MNENITIVDEADAAKWHFQPAAKQADGALTGSLTAAYVFTVAG